MIHHFKKVFECSYYKVFKCKTSNFTFKRYSNNVSFVGKYGQVTVRVSEQNIKEIKKAKIHVARCKNE